MNWPLEIRTYRNLHTRGLLIVVFWLFAVSMMAWMKDGDVKLTVGICFAKFEYSWSFGIAKGWLP